MRRPLRKPHGLQMESIENWTETADYIIRLNGTTYEAINGATGEVDSSSTTAATVIQYALDNTTRGTVKVVSDISLDTALTGVDSVVLDFTHHDVTLTADVNFYDQDNADYTGVRNVDIYCPDTYTGTILDLDTTAGSIWWSNFEHIRVFDTHTNYTYTGLRLHCPGANAIRNCIFRDLTFWNVDKGVHFETGANTGWMGVNLFEHIFINHCVIGFDFEIFDDTANGPNRNTFINCQVQTSLDTTHGFKDVCNAANLFINCMVQDWATAAAPVARWSIHANSNNTMIIDADGQHDYYTDAGTATMILCKNAEIQASYINRGPRDVDLRLFKDTDGNPTLYMYGDDTGAERVVTMSVTANGSFQIAQETGTATIKLNDAGKIEMNGTAPNDVIFFGGSGTGENKYLDIVGRDNADANVKRIKIRWGGTANDEGEIVTDGGDIFLNPAGVVKFGTKTGTGDAALDGYVTIKDAAGNTIKLATTA